MPVNSIFAVSRKWPLAAKLCVKGSYPENVTNVQTECTKTHHVKHGGCIRDHLPVR